MTPGAFFYVFGIITSLPFALSIIVIINKWNVLKKKRQPFVFVSIGLLPVLGMLGQALNPDYSISLPSIVVNFPYYCFRFTKSISRYRLFNRAI